MYSNLKIKRGNWRLNVVIWVCNQMPLYLAVEYLDPKRWFSQGETYLLHFACADPCNFLKCGKLSCIICGSGGTVFVLSHKRKKKDDF